MQSALLTVPETERRLVLDRYEPVRRLGSGGFGTVWLARDLKLGRMVALKRIGMTDAQVAQRARRESLAAARLSHPAIVSLYEAVADEDAVYLVSEHVSGRTLADRVRDGSLSDLDVLEIGIVLCDALAHAHKRGVVHRDVKPQNIIIPDAAAGDGSTTAKLTDFGIALLSDADAMTETGDVVGTLAYMAPEQADGRAVTPASDLYALGLCIYEALTGVNPVRAHGAAATARRVGRRLPSVGRLRRDLREELTAAIDATVGSDPATRGTLRDLRDALVGSLASATDDAGPVDGPAPPLRTRRHWPHAAERRSAFARPPAALAGALAYSLLAMLGPEPPLDVLALARGRRGGCASYCRGSAGSWRRPRSSAWAVAAGQPGSALLLAAAAAPVPILLLRSPLVWSAPSAARPARRRRRQRALPGARRSACPRRGSAPRSVPSALGGCCWPSRCPANGCSPASD